MALGVQVLFDMPQCELASILRERFNACKSASLIAGFITVEGIESIAAPLRSQPGKLTNIVAGAGTYRAFQAFDSLLSAGVPADRLFVHLGHSRQTGGTAKHPFYRYHPMLHSKVYLFEMANGSTTAFVGSHNLTGFALLGLNGEAGVRLDGPTDSPEFDAIRAHIATGVAQSVNYSPGMKEAYSWWNSQFLEGLRDKANDYPRDGEGTRTIVILAAQAARELPKENDLIYFEIPAALPQIRSMSTEVHIYVFKVLPKSPWEALAQMGQAVASFWCRTEGLENEKGGLELLADWHFEDRAAPKLKHTTKPFRPKPTAGMQQVRVRVFKGVFDRFEYLFETKQRKWTPVYDRGAQVRAKPDDRSLLESLSLIPPEDREWYLVTDLQAAEPTGTEAYREALKQVSPDSGAFILISPRRRKRDAS